MDRDDVELADFAWASGVAGLDEPLTGAPKPKKGYPCHFGRAQSPFASSLGLENFSLVSFLCVVLSVRVGVCRGCVPWVYAVGTVFKCGRAHRQCHRELDLCEHVPNPRLCPRTYRARVL